MCFFSVHDWAGVVYYLYFIFRIGSFIMYIQWGLLLYFTSQDAISCREQKTLNRTGLNIWRRGGLRPPSLCDTPGLALLFVLAVSLIHAGINFRCQQNFSSSIPKAAPRPPGQETPTHISLARIGSQPTSELITAGKGEEILLAIY